MVELKRVSFVYLFFFFDGSEWKRVKEKIREIEKVVNSSWKSYKDSLGWQKDGPWDESHNFMHKLIYYQNITANLSKRSTYIFFLHLLRFFFNTNFLYLHTENFIRKVWFCFLNKSLKYSSNILTRNKMRWLKMSEYSCILKWK